MWNISLCNLKIFYNYLLALSIFCFKTGFITCILSVAGIIHILNVGIITTGVIHALSWKLTFSGWGNELFLQLFQKLKSIYFRLNSCNLVHYQILLFAIMIFLSLILGFLWYFYAKILCCIDLLIYFKIIFKLIP